MRCRRKGKERPSNARLATTSRTCSDSTHLGDLTVLTKTRIEIDFQEVVFLQTRYA